MVDRDYLGAGLTRALREGLSALPADLEALVGHLRILEGLLGEKAVELEPTWALAQSNAAEIEVLLELQDLIVERAIALQAEGMDDVLAKLAIWRALSDGAEYELRAEDPPMLNRLILSVEADLARLGVTSFIR